MNVSDFDIIFQEQVTVVHAAWLNGANCTLNSIANVRNYGACGDGVTDDTEWIQAAIASGLPTYFPAGNYKVTDTLTLTTKGQVIFGDNRNTSVITIDSSFVLAGRIGVFVATCGEEGPYIRDLGMNFIQPDTATRAALIAYPPALCLKDTPRFTLYNLRIACAMVGIDMTGNSGGAFLDQLEISAFTKSIDIDGSLDTVRISNVHCWNFGTTSSIMTANQLTIYRDGTTIGFDIGTADDLKISNCLFIMKGPQINMHAGVGGVGCLGMCTQTDFDTFASVVCTKGQMSFTNCFFTVGDTTIQTLHQTLGWLRFTNCEFEMAVIMTQPMLQIYPDATNTIATTPWTVFVNCQFRTAPNATVIKAGQSVGSSLLHLINCDFMNAPNTVQTLPMIEVNSGARATLIGNRITDKGTGAGVFIKVDVDDQHVITGNSFTGWTMTCPTTHNFGIYTQNIGLPTSFVAGNLDGQLQIKELTGTLDGAGAATIAHGIGNAQLKVISVTAFCKNGAGGANVITVTSVDGLDVFLTGGIALANCRVALFYTSDQQSPW